MKANQLKKGSAFELDGNKYLVTSVQTQSPSARGGNTLYKVTARDVVSKQKFDKTFKGDETVQEMELVRRAVQLLYAEADSTTFMDNESYEQYTADNHLIESDRTYLCEGIDIMALLSDGSLLGVELPGTVVMTITECAPSIKGASASARTKPATLTTGLVVQVPEYLSPGESIKISTATGEFVSRA